MSQQPVAVEVVFKLPGDCAETRLEVAGERSHVLSDPQKIQQILEIMGLPEGASAKVLFTTRDVVVR